MHVQDIHKGELILVNNAQAYQSSGKSDFVGIYEVKNHSYKVKDKNSALNKTVIPHLNKMMADFEKAENLRDIIILSGYRTTAEQERILNRRAQQLGMDKATETVALPGYSEHHTGYAIDIGIYKDNGQSLNYTGSGKYGWINKNCGNYGFILRYPGIKSKITKITDEPWHYRYVGIPHANIMKENDLCLEEYVEYLKGYDSQSNPLLFTDTDQAQYKIYYVKATDGITKIPVPRGKKYSISGNNTDGFIFTVGEK